MCAKAWAEQNELVDWRQKQERGRCKCPLHTAVREWACDWRLTTKLWQTLTNSYKLWQTLTNSDKLLQTWANLATYALDNGHGAGRWSKLRLRWGSFSHGGAYMQCMQRGVSFFSWMLLCCLQLVSKKIVTVSWPDPLTPHTFPPGLISYISNKLVVLTSWRGYPPPQTGSPPDLKSLGVDLGAWLPPPVTWLKFNPVQGSQGRGRWRRRWVGGRVDAGCWQSSCVGGVAPQGVGMTRSLSSSNPLSSPPAKTSNWLMNNWQVQQKANEQLSTIRWWRYKRDTPSATTSGTLGIINDSFACREILALEP